MDAFALLPVLVFSFAAHELAHAWQARREGDDTPEKDGRITLNPLAHLDFFGSFVVPVALFVSGTGFLFGWAKPVMVNPRNYRDPVWGDVRVSLAGIVANLGIAAVATVLMAIVVKWGSQVGTAGEVGVTLDALYLMLQYALILNLILAIFNLIPIPPLDGSHVVAHLMPPPLRARYRRFGPYAFAVLIAALYLGRFVGLDLFSILLWPVTALQGFADAFVRLWI